MRVLLLIVLIAMFPLRGFASVGMQTHMGMTVLHQTMAIALISPIVESGTTISDVAPTDTEGTCCAQCSVCDLCQLLVGQASDPLSTVAVLRPLQPESVPFSFASADRRTAHKPPLALI